MSIVTIGSLVVTWYSPGKNTGVGCHTLSEGIFPTQRSNPCIMSPVLIGGFFTTGATWEAHLQVYSVQFSSVQSLLHVQLFVTPWTATHQASLSITNSQSLLMFIQLVMPSNYLILGCPLFFLPSVFPSIRVFSSESLLHIRWQKYCSFSFQHQSFQ